MTIYKIQLNEVERLNYTASHFGDNFPFRIEPFIYDMARNLSGDYTGGYWDMFELSNGAFYMAPDSDMPFHVICMNGYEGTLSADSFGITVCLYAYSNLSFSPELSDVCAEHFHLLREYMFEHAEVKAIPIGNRLTCRVVRKRQSGGVAATRGGAKWLPNCFAVGQLGSGHDCPIVGGSGGRVGQYGRRLPGRGVAHAKTRQYRQKKVVKAAKGGITGFTIFPPFSGHRCKMSGCCVG